MRALDAQGKPLVRLEPDEVQVLENGAERTIKSIVKDEVPLDLVLIVDTSGSMYGNVAAVAKTAREALRALRPGDRAALMSFNFRPKWRQELTSDLSQFEASLKNLVQERNFGGGTILSTPIYAAAEKLLKESPKSNRRAILILTDGVGFKGTSRPKVLNALWEGDITLNALEMEAASRWVRQTRRKVRVLPPFSFDSNITPLVVQTSGEKMSMNDTNAPLVEILERIRSRFTVYYEPLGSEIKERNVVAGLSAVGKTKHLQGQLIGRRQYSVH